MKPMRIAKGACMVVGAATFAAAALMAALFAFTSLELPRSETTSLRLSGRER